MMLRAYCKLVALLVVVLLIQLMECKLIKEEQVEADNSTKEATEPCKVTKKTLHHLITGLIGLLMNLDNSYQNAPEEPEAP